MSEHDWEPVRGLPGHLPAGEEILWQGSPDWRTLARTVFHLRVVIAYFVALALVGVALGSFGGAVATAIAGGAAIGVVSLLAWAIAKSTVYTLTNRRVVLRIGVALPKCFNLPLRLVTSADLRPLAEGHGDIALALGGGQRIGYAFLWPHARPWHVKTPQPMLRALPDAEDVAARLARACAALTPIERAVAAPSRVPLPVDVVGAAA